jgi:hypothetical protein
VTFCSNSPLAASDRAEDVAGMAFAGSDCADAVMMSYAGGGC